MRKILSLVLVLSLVLGSMSMAFATTELTADIEDPAIKEAVTRLAAFGIVNGMDDGKYHPDKKVTREQFAKLVVEALGLGDAANAAKGATQFADVEADRWSSGYINTAVGQGVLKGYPDGNFNPTKEVTYAEAVTMLVRGLGYKDDFLKGSWPGNYVGKAAELDITDDVSFSTTGTADRGSVAIMVNNTLDAKIVKVSAYEGSEHTYEVSDVTLLEDKLDIDKVEDIRVVATQRLDDKLESDELRLLAIEDRVEVDDVRYDEGEEIEVEFSSDVNAEALIGLEITGYFDGDELMFTEVETPDASYYRGIAYEDGYEGDEDKDQGEDDDGKLYLRDLDKFYKFDSNVQIYVNNRHVDDSDITWDRDDELIYNLRELLTGDKDFDVQVGNDSYAFGNVILEKGKVTFVDVAVYEIQSGVVEEVNEDDKIIEYVDTWDGDTNEELDLDDYDEIHVYTTDGTAMELADIEKDDMIHFYEHGEDDDKAYIMVKKDAAVIGELTKVKRGYENRGQSRGKLYLGDDAYSLANQFAYSLDEMDSIEGAYDHDDLNDIFENAYEEDVKLFLDTKGRVALVTTDVDATTGNYAVVLDTDDGINDEIKLWTETGDTDTYEIDDYEDGLELDDLKEGDIIEYDLEDDATIDVIAKVYDASSGEAVGDYAHLAILDDINKDNVEVEDADRNNYHNEADSLYIDYSEYNENGDNDDDDLDVLEWDEIKDLDTPDADDDDAAVVLIVTDDKHDDEIALLAFIENYDEVADDDSYVGYLIFYDTNDDVMTVEVDVLGEGVEEYKVTDSDDQEEIEKLEYETPIVFVLKGGELKLKDREDNYDDNEHYGSVEDGEVSIWFKEKDDNDIVVYNNGNEERYRVDDDAIIYNEEDEKNLNKLKKGYAIEFIMKNSEILVLKYREASDLDEKDEYDYERDEIDLEVEEDEITLTVGEEAQIELADLDPESAEVEYESDDEDVVTVDDDGEITAVGVGEAEITVTATKTGYETAEVTVEVTVTEEAEATAEVSGTIVEFGVNIFTVTVDDVEGLNGATHFTISEEDDVKEEIGGGESITRNDTGNEMKVYIFDEDGDLLATGTIVIDDEQEEIDETIDLTLE